MEIKIHKFLVCDEVREEKTGKLFIIGLYHDDIMIVNTLKFPYTHPMFGILVTGEADQPIEKMQIQIKGPDKNIIIDSPMKGPGKNKEIKNFQFIISANISGFVINKPGIYEICILANGYSVPHSFEVRHNKINAQPA